MLGACNPQRKSSGHITRRYRTACALCLSYSFVYLEHPFGQQTQKMPYSLGSSVSLQVLRSVQPSVCVPQLAVVLAQRKKTHIVVFSNLLPLFSSISVKSVNNHNRTHLIVSISALFTENLKEFIKNLVTISGGDLFSRIVQQVQKFIVTQIVVRISEVQIPQEIFSFLCYRNSRDCRLHKQTWIILNRSFVVQHLMADNYQTAQIVHRLFVHFAHSLNCSATRSAGRDAEDIIPTQNLCFVLIFKDSSGDLYNRHKKSSGCNFLHPALFFYVRTLYFLSANSCSTDTPRTAAAASNFFCSLSLAPSLSSK